jgi:malate synthase
MEDAATAEIARVQLWQWVFHNARLDSGHPITAVYIEKVIKQAAQEVKVPAVSPKHVEIAARYLIGQIQADKCSEFLTSDLMPYLEALDGGRWVKSAL